MCCQKYSGLQALLQVQHLLSFKLELRQTVLQHLVLQITIIFHLLLVREIQLLHISQVLLVQKQCLFLLIVRVINGYNTKLFFQQMIQLLHQILEQRLLHMWLMLRQILVRVLLLQQVKALQQISLF